MQLTSAELSRVKELTDLTYPFLAPEVRLYLNEQLLEAKYRWEVADWLERLEATYKYFQAPEVKIKARRRKGVSAS